MSYQPHYIASFEEDSGLFTYTEPFLAPEKAFPVLEDAYCFRGSVIRRPGFTLLGRLRRKLTAANANTISSATLTYNLFTGLGLLAVAPFETNAQLQPGSEQPITIVVGAQTLTDTTGTGVMVVAPVGGANPIATATINYSTGILTLTFANALAPVVATFSGAYYPGLPVMGLRTQELGAINDEGMIAFDQKYAYWFNPTPKQFEELPSVLAVTWHGSNSDFFYSTNYWTNPTAPPPVSNRLFWATNTNMTGGTRDPVRYYNGSPLDAGVTWSAAFNPKLTDTGNKSYLYNAEIILPYKGRLLFLNTWEGEGPAVDITKAINYPQRVRYSWQKDPLDAEAFRTDLIGRGGWIGAPTAEAIVGAEYIKDTLIVKFERSSWKLVWTGNEVFPFVFEKINTELGSESKFSLVPFDRGVFSVADYGITTDDSVNVQRIDLQIPNSIFQFNNDQQGPVRVHGIRDYTKELVYWTYPTSRKPIVNGVASVGYPDKVLMYNYRNNTYAKFNDSFTCYGYYQTQNDTTWADLPYESWEDWIAPWDSGSLQSLFPNVIAGNQEGFVEIVGTKAINDASLFIKAITIVGNFAQFTVPQHNLSNNDIIKISGVIGGGATNPSGLNGFTFQVTVVDPDTITLKVFWTDGKFYYVYFPGNIIPNLVDATSIYIGNGLITKINNFTIQTKRFAPFYESGSQCRLGYVDYLFIKTDNGELKSAVFIDENSSISMTDSVLNPCLSGTQTVNTKPDNLTLIPFQATQDKIWHRQFVQAVAQNFMINLTMTPEQNATLSIAGEDLKLYAIAFYLSPNARLTQ